MHQIRKFSKTKTMVAWFSSYELLQLVNSSIFEALIFYSSNENSHFNVPVVEHTYPHPQVSA